MDSYTFSSDSTSSFFVKETTSDVVVDMENIADSLIEMNQPAANVLEQIDKAQAGPEVEVDPNQMFVITIGDQHTQPANTTQPEHTVQFAQVDVEGSIHLSLSEMEMPQSVHAIETMVNQSESQGESGNQLVDDQQEEDDDHFDMEQFISTKATSTPIAGGGRRDDYANQDVNKYFTECGSNSVKCNLCSDVLLSNRPNLVLHLRHVHKYDKREANFGKVWKYYTKMDSFKAKCALCAESFVYRNRMSTLIKHLHEAHKEHTESELRCSKATASPTATAAANAPWSDVIVIQNSHGKLVNQIKVNKSWKCFTKLPNSDKMICNLCKKIFTHKQTNDLLHHLHQEHKSLLGIKQEQEEATRDEEPEAATTPTQVDSVEPAAAGAAKSVIVQKVGKHPTRLGRSLKTSKIWEYFTECSSDKVMCSLCNKVLANNYSTSNLLRHLSARHKEAYNAIKELAASDMETIKIVIQNENGQLDGDVSVADMLEDYRNLLTSNESGGGGGPAEEDSPAARRASQPLSETWSHFTKLKVAGRARCNKCNATLAYSNGATSNLTRHLRLKHSKLHDKTATATATATALEKSPKIEPADVTTLVIVADDNQTDPVCQLADTQNETTDSTIDISISNTNNTLQSSEPTGKLGSIAQLTFDTSDHDVAKTELNGSSSSAQPSKPADYFKKGPSSENRTRICTLCSKEIATNSNASYRLSRHLKLEHGLSFIKKPRPRKEFLYDSDSSDDAANKDSSGKEKEVTVEDAAPTAVADTSTDLLSDGGNNLNNSNSEGKVTGRTWKHFTKLDREKAKCNLCGHLLTYKLGQTSNLINHIKSKHQDMDNSRGEISPQKTSHQEPPPDNEPPLKSFENTIETVWKYFTKLEDCKAMCNLCEFPNIFSHPQKSKSHLVKHLNRKHRHLLNTLAGEEPVSIQMPAAAYLTKKNSSGDDSRPAAATPTPLNYCESENDEDEMGDMKSLYEYLIADEKLKRCIKFENNQIKCKVCSGSFVCNNLINYEYTIRYHVQIFHAEWTVMCFDEKLIKRECVSPEPDTPPKLTHSQQEPNYNELEAIANEVNSFVHCSDATGTSHEPPLTARTSHDPVKTVKTIKQERESGVAPLSEEIWKYFTKLTSQNVRCNFCSIMLSFRQHKKWNLVRHLKLKHRSKINSSLFNKHINVKRRVNLQSKKSGKTVSSIGPKRSGAKKETDTGKNVKTEKKDLPKSEKDKTSTLNKKKKNNKKSNKSNSRNASRRKNQILPSLFSSPINRKIGRTWSHFTKIDMGKAQCNICSNMLLYRGTGIDLLNDHLTSKHASFFDGSQDGQPKKTYTKKIHFDTKIYESSSSSSAAAASSSSSSSSESSDVEEKEAKRKSPTVKRKAVLDKDEDFQPPTTPKQETSYKQCSRVWQYFTKVDEGYAKCQLCLSEISYRWTTSNLVRHLQKIHSVISLITPEKEDECKDMGMGMADEMATEQSRLLAAVDLTPIKSQQQKHVCYVRLSNNLVRCNFCPRVLYHKSGNMHKLMSHILYKHRQETAKYKSTKNLKFANVGKEIVLTVCVKAEKLAAPTVAKPKVDNRKVFRSNTWLYFTKLNDQYARCNICSNAFSFKGGSIYNLTRHLLLKHDVKLIKRHEISQKKLASLPTPRYTSYKKKSETLSFYKKINRDTVRCKLCMKRFVYRGLNTKTLVNHLWSNHIKKLIDPSGSAPNYLNIANNESESLAAQDSEDGFSGDKPVVTNKDVDPTQSDISNYFTQLDDAEKNVQCNVCQKTYSLKTDGLTALSQHLQTVHNIEKSFNACDAQTKVEPNETTMLPVDDVKQSDQPKNLDKDVKEGDSNEMEIYDYFLKSNNCDDEVQCKFCDHVLKRDNLPELKMHLTTKHDMKVFLFDDKLKRREEKCLDRLPVGMVELKSNIERLGRIRMLQMKCKLCYTEMTVKRNDALNCLTEHLRTSHETIFKEKLCQEPMEEGAPATATDGGDCRKVSKHLAFNYFKNLQSSREKCAVCLKFISAKRCCNHHITNDLSVRYSVRNVKQRKVAKEKVRHCMSVNSNDNKCYECMVSQYSGYCIHSLNQMLTNEYKKKYGNGMKNNADSQVSINSDQVQIIADSLNGCAENNIIIITDNDDTTSVLNYDLANRTEAGSQDSISYHIMNSINEIDDDDIKVIIYNYNSEEGAAANEPTGVKVDQTVAIDKPSPFEPSPSEALEEHLNSIVNELNTSAQVAYTNENDDAGNECLMKSKEFQSSSLMQVDEQTATDTKVDHKSYDLEKLTELAEVSCNEQFYKRNSLMNNTEPVEVVEVEADMDGMVRPGGTGSRCIVENIYPETDIAASMAFEKDYVTNNVVYKSVEVESCAADEMLAVNGTGQGGPIEEVIGHSPEKEKALVAVEEGAEVTSAEDTANGKHSQVLSEDVINAIFNEVMVNLQEQQQQPPAADQKQVNLIKLHDDDIEVPSGLFLQDLKNQYKINRLVLCFINIDYKYKTAKCNLCRTYLEFSEPIIYNLLMHLFGQHKEKVCTEEPVNKAAATPSGDSLANSVAHADGGVSVKQRKKSPVWKYFINEKNFRAFCKICNFSFSYKGGAINNLSRHLRLRHNIVVSSKCVDNSDYDISCLVTYPKRRSSVKLRSKTWNYFSKEPNDWAKCRICKKYLSYRSSTINNLTRHLRTIHSKIFNSLFTDKEPAMFIKNEDGSLSENADFLMKDEKSDMYNSMLETSNIKSRDEILQQCSYSSVENNRRKSIVWNYFTELSANCGKCNFCCKVISCKGGGTSNLSRHLRSRHGIWIVLTSNLSQTFSETMNDGGYDVTASAADTIITQEQLHILKNRKLVHKKSKTWEYFTKETVDRVRCNLCSKPLSYKCKAVHNLRRHLAKKHPACIVKPDPIRLKLQINTENDVLHNSNVMQDDAEKKFIDITDTSVVIVDEEMQLPPNRPDRNVRPKKSIVWNYFEELEYGIAKCLICAKVLSFRGGGTNNLMRHLRCRHSIIILNQSESSVNTQHDIEAETEPELIVPEILDTPTT